MTTEDETNNDTVQGTQDDAGTVCTICMEEWTIGGDHRLCCLKCGHLFGRECIERWIKEKGGTSKCPTCNKPAKKADLRDLWCKNIKASDNTEITKYQTLLENEKKLRKSDSAVIFHQNLKLELLEGDLKQLKKRLIERDAKIKKLEAIIDKYNQMRANRSDNENQDSFRQQQIPDLECQEVDIEIDDIIPVELKGQFHHAEKILSSPTGGCKAFTLCPTTSIILVAQPAPQNSMSRNLFAPYGLRRYSTLDTKIKEYIPLHNNTITSIQLKPVGDLILTASMDKKVKLTSIINNTCIQTYNCDHHPSCVAWSAHRDNQFYVASGNCFVTIFDIRNTSEYIYQTSDRVARTRILSIASTSSEELNGIIVNDMKGSQYLEVSQSSSYELESIDRSLQHLTSLNLPFEGLMGTVDYNKRLDLTLISTRRSTTNKNCTHNLIQLKKAHNDEGLSCMEAKPIRAFTGGSTNDDQPLLSHSRILRHPTLADSVLVGATDQASNGVKLWDSSDNTVYQTIKTDKYIRDMVMYSPENSNQHVLYLLSEVGLNIYRWDYA